jgi:RHS repeat-associated protein
MKSDGSVARHDFLPFGEEIQGIGGRTAGLGYVADNVRQKFTQKERDNESGLDYFLARYYSSAQGRFTSPDPRNVMLERQDAEDAEEGNALLKGYLQNPQHWNRYPYALNNPLKYVDPTGEAEEIVVNLNFVYDKNRFKNEEEARKALTAHIANLNKVYGRLNITFNITFTAGKAADLNTDRLPRITEGKKEGSINVFVTNQYGPAPGMSIPTRGESFINLYGISSVPLGGGIVAHEVGHQFGVGAKGVLSNIISDIQIELANFNLGVGGRAAEGIDWVDDYRTATQVLTYGRFAQKTIPRRPTTYDIYRVGARRFASKK